MITNNSAPARIHAIDLFCGIGGLTHGLEMSGIEVRAGFDIDPSCGFAYRANNQKSEFIAVDVRSLNFHDLAPYYKDADITVMVGCAPCQPFSALTRKTNPSLNDNCSLVREFVRLIGEGTPDLISMENVPGLVKHDAFKEMLSVLDSLGYQYVYGVLSCADYGVPQTRKRLVLVASRIGTIALPSPVERRTNIAEFIQCLPPLEDGETSQDDPAHTTLPLSSQNRQRIRQSKPGGTWQDWDQSYINKCHQKAYYPAPYGRMHWDSMAPTITTQFCYYSTGRFGHPTQNRTISVREAALLQTFPVGYQLLESDKKVTIWKIARHIGNAVPVKLAEAIGKSIMEGANAR